MPLPMRVACPIRETRRWEFHLDESEIIPILTPITITPITTLVTILVIAIMVINKAWKGLHLRRMWSPRCLERLRVLFPLTTRPSVAVPAIYPAMPLLMMWPLRLTWIQRPSCWRCRRIRLVDLALLPPLTTALDPPPSPPLPPHPYHMPLALPIPPLPATTLSLLAYNSTLDFATIFPPPPPPPWAPTTHSPLPPPTSMPSMPFILPSPHLPPRQEAWLNPRTLSLQTPPLTPHPLNHNPSNYPCSPAQTPLQSQTH